MSGARRAKGNEKLPKNVYADQSRYVYRPYLGNGKRGTPIRLCGLDASIAEIWDAYNKVVAKEYNTIGWLIDQYLSSPKFQERAVGTQENYRRYANTIKNFTGRSGRLADCPIDQFTTKLAQKYLDARNMVTGNREIEFLSTCFSWGYQRLEEITSNPCKGVDYHTEVPRDRYVTDEEYKLVYDLALEGRARYVPILMELIYLCRARPNEIYLMKKDAIRENGLFLERGKGSENEITGWSDRLETALIRALELWPTGDYLMYDERGSVIKKRVLNNVRARLMQKALKKGLKEPFTFHDLKAKGVSDHTQKFAGHRSEKMKRVYDRVPGIVNATR